MSSHEESIISINKGNPDEFIEDLVLDPQFKTNLNKQKENEK
jgi:hypothetical protein